jgi:hypothetical protein
MLDTVGPLHSADMIPVRDQIQSNKLLMAFLQQAPYGISVPRNIPFLAAVGKKFGSVPQTLTQD